MTKLDLILLLIFFHDSILIDLRYWCLVLIIMFNIKKDIQPSFDVTVFINAIEYYFLHWGTIVGAAHVIKNHVLVIMSLILVSWFLVVVYISIIPIWYEIALSPLSSILFYDVFKNKLYGNFLTSFSYGYINDFFLLPIVSNLDLYPLVVSLHLLFEKFTTLENMRFLQLNCKSMHLLRLTATHFNEI